MNRMKWLGWTAAICLAILMAAGLSFYASQSPDGLEAVAARTGADAHQADSAAAVSPLADYRAAGVPEDRRSVAVAGICGIAITGAASIALTRLLRRRAS